MGLNKGNFFLTLGLLFFLAAIFVAGFNLYIGIQAGEEARDIANAIKVVVKDKPIDTTGFDSEGKEENEYLDRDMPAIEVLGYSYIGTLEIPDLELVLPIMEDWNDERLRISPCRYYGSYYEDNMVIAGHNYARHFSPIKTLPVGAQIFFEDVEGNVYEYEIAWSESLKGTQIEEMTTKSGEPGKEWDLTLFTCTFDGSKRVAIRCIRTDK